MQWRIAVQCCGERQKRLYEPLHEIGLRAVRHRHVESEAFQDVRVSVRVKQFEASRIEPIGLAAGQLGRQRGRSQVVEFDDATRGQLGKSLW